MGLLEEAIREHLELQRRRGADPNRVARAEQEALEPLVPGQTPAWAEGPMLFDHDQPSPEVTQAFRSATDAPEVPPPQALVEQETAELDMSTVLGSLGSGQEPSQPFAPGIPEFAPGGPLSGPVRARRIVRGAEAAGSGLDGDFEWEVPERTAQAAETEPSARQGSFAFE